MKLNFLKTLFLIGLLAITISPKIVAKELIINSIFVDDEYELYKKKADNYYKNGDYQNAIKQYKNCLEVPKFEQDSYAINQLKLAGECLELRQKAENALSQNKPSDAVVFYKAILEKNNADVLTKNTLSNYFEAEGTKLYEQKKYQEAKNNYKDAIKYVPQKEATLTLLVQNCEEKIKIQQIEIDKQAELAKIEQARKTEEQRIINEKVKADELAKKEANKVAEVFPQNPIAKPISVLQPEAKRSPVLKILTAAVGLGAGLGAYSLKKTYDDKVTALNKVGAEVDPNGTGIILTQTGYDQWQKAYNDVKTAQSKQKMATALIGVAVGAIVLEIIQIALPVKSKKVAWKPTENSYGIALQYRF